MLVFLCTLDDDSLCVDQVFHILSYHQPPILCWDGRNTLLHCTRYGIW